jgi:hypothetical protein
VAARVDALEQAADQLFGVGRRLGVVGDAEAAAEVEVGNGDAFGLERLDQVEQAVERLEIGRAFGDLRADVAVDADDLEAGQPRAGGTRRAPRCGRCRTCCRAGRSRCRDASSRRRRD